MNKAQTRGWTNTSLWCDVSIREMTQRTCLVLLSLERHCHFSGTGCTMEALVSIFGAGSGVHAATVPRHPWWHLWLPRVLLPPLECALGFVNVVGEHVFPCYRAQPPASCVIWLKFASPFLIYFVCLGGSFTAFAFH